ncbi:MAG: response regulator [Acidobacteria bacterium]|jgi:class 3 adenylate cyclase/CheY-like chemotaxis protein|nr:response regulator [Acidobacteriota bacterium]
MSDPTKIDPQARLRHDLRTPLHQIIGYAELLEDEARDCGDDEYLEDLQKIRTAARRALEVADLAAPPTPAGATSGVFREVSSSEAGAGRAEPRPPTPPVDASGVSILVVDDNELNRDMLSRRLGGRGFQVETAEDGTLALGRLDEKSFDIVLLDVMMPGLSGLDVLGRVRERWSESDLPVIMVTARDATEDVVEALRAGANDYVTKPLDFPVVLARVEMQLTLKRQTEEIRRLAEDLELRNRFIRGLFGRYVSEEVVAGLLASPEGPTLGGEYRKVTLLMSDLRGFTPLTEGLSPEQVLRLLNSYLAAMADVILAHQGTIDEFVGDGILAIFGAPLARDDDAERAVACAVAMQAALVGLNERNTAEGLPHLEMGVSVHTGNVIVGNIGSERRTKYGVVGSAVNHAGRIESFTVGGQVLISDATRAEAGERVRVGARLAIDAKGTREPIVVYDLRGVGEEGLPDAAEEATPLPDPIRALCHVVEGKRVEAEAFGAEVIELSSHGATVLSPRRLRPLSNLKLELRPSGRDPVEIYAKVVSVAPGGSVTVRFTSLPAEIDRWLRELVADARSRQE